MGSREDEAGHRSDEEPAHVVTLTQGFWLGSTEVTIGQWRAVMGTSLREHVTHWLRDGTGHDFSGRRATVAEYMNMDPQADPESFLANENEALPMYFVNWNDAIAFCDQLTQSERSEGDLPANYSFTLPTEAQWEYACRAGSTEATYAGDDDVLTNIAWFSGNSADGYSGKKLPRASAGPRNVREKKPNVFGLHDMSGNLWEWCLDWYGPYTGGAQTDPTGPATGDTRVNRGGSWGSGPGNERSACRAGNPPAEASAYRGFRVALIPANSPSLSRR
jgi:formylglycine-generating enzyme required for sulfatase activity